MPEGNRARLFYAFIGILMIATGSILFLISKRHHLVMGIIHLSIELAFDFIAFLMGGILILQAKDNYLKLYWGIIASCIGLFFIWENIGWLMIVTDTPEYPVHLPAQYRQKC